MRQRIIGSIFLCFVLFCFLITQQSLSKHNRNNIVDIDIFDFVSGVHSLPCWSQKKCQAPFPGRFGICPCGERSPCSACPQRKPISLFPGHGRGPCHKTHRPAGSTASPALWFAVNGATFREGTEREERWPQRGNTSGGKGASERKKEREGESGISVFA